jgi:hypothetical protein
MAIEVYSLIIILMIGDPVGATAGFSIETDDAIFLAPYILRR